MSLGRWHAGIDAAIVAWAILWVLMGLRVADEVRGLSELSGTVIEVGVAVQSAGEAIGSLSDVPFAGDRVRQPSEDIRAAGRSAVASGRSSRESVRDLSTLLGFAVAVIPTAPLLFVYLPARVGWWRDRRAVAEMLRDAPAGGQRAVHALLARRALGAVSYRHLQRSGLLGGALDERDVEQLAAAELRRLRLRGPTGEPSR
jgi:hypothetical protein